MSGVEAWRQADRAWRLALKICLEHNMAIRVA
jgi:hypothetical protein